MNRKSKVIVSIVGITIVLLALLGITYAYYLTRIQGNTNTNSISVTTADLKLKYEDGNGLLTATNIMPGKQVEFKTTNNTTTTEKTFTVTNSGNSTIEGYAVSLDYAYIADTMPSIFEHPEDFQITLTCTTSKIGETCNGFTGKFNNESIMMTSNDIDENEVHTYSLSIYYNDPGVDQSNDMGKNLNLKIQIYNISESADIEGTITGVDSTYAVRIESEPKISTIVNGKYNFKGVEIGTHTLTVLDKDGNEVDKEYIVVKSGTTPSIAITKAMIDDTEVDAIGITITKEERIAKLSTKVESNVLSLDISTSNTEIFNPYSNNKNSLTYNILNNSISTNSVAYNKTNYITLDLQDGTTYSIPSKQSSNVNERVLTYTTDDYGASYYFRGNIEDNYVNFAGMCWRIVRIAGDGSTKLILEDATYECNNSSYTGNWIIRGGNYGYELKNVDNDTSDETIMNYLNPTASKSLSMVKAFYDFQTTKLVDYTSKLKSGDWCLGDKAYTRSGSSGSYTYTLLSEYNYSSSMYYDSYARLISENVNGYQPTLKCNGTVLDKFSTATAVSVEVPMYVSAISADEVVYAGVKIGEDNGNYYLLNDYQKNQTSKYVYFWSLSAASFSGAYDNAFYVSNNGRMTYTSVSQYEATIVPTPVSDGYSFYLAFRPSINLLSSTRVVAGGDGTINNPYVIE